MIVGTVTGLISHTPRVHNTRSGERVLNLDVAARQRVKKDGHFVSETVYIDVTIFGARADSIGALLKKGSQIGATGEWKFRRYTGRDGTPKMAIELMASNIWPLDWTPRERAEGPPPAQPAATRPPPAFVDEDDNIPF